MGGALSFDGAYHYVATPFDPKFRYYERNDNISVGNAKQAQRNADSSGKKLWHGFAVCNQI